jgi:hypothetical protein
LITLPVAFVDINTINRIHSVDGIDIEMSQYMCHGRINGGIHLLDCRLSCLVASDRAMLDFVILHSYIAPLVVNDRSAGQ